MLIRPVVCYNTYGRPGEEKNQHNAFAARRGVYIIILFMRKDARVPARNGFNLWYANLSLTEVYYKNAFTNLIVYTLNYIIMVPAYLWVVLVVTTYKYVSMRHLWYILTESLTTESG